MNYKISVIVPVYNVENYLKRCLDSIINQTYKNIEIILINDGSKDSSGMICDDYSRKYSYIKTVHQKNKGLSGARNTGLENATGDYISFIDSDDWIELDMYETMINLSLEYNLDIVECDIQYSSIPKQKQDVFFKIENNIQFAKRMIDNRFFSVCRRIYSKKLIKDLKFIVNYIYEDMIFSSYLLKRISKIGYINKPFYNYYIENTNSIMHGTYNLRNVNSIETIEIFEENIKNNYTNIQVLHSARGYITFFAFHHYQQLFKHKNFDKDSKLRTYLKQTIERNYNSKAQNNFHIKTARYFPMWLFNIFHKLNSLRNV